jgi:UTP--glucose-1-phosphate uridylyltransferase
MADTYAFHRGSVLGVEEVPRGDTDKYGIVEVENPADTVSQLRSIVEKPKPSVAPSTRAVVGRYLLTPGIFDELRQIGRGAGGEIQLTDGISRLLKREAVYAHCFTGKRFDCGSKLGYLQATVEHALAHPQLARDFRRYLVGLSKTLLAPGPVRAAATKAAPGRAKRAVATKKARKSR